MNTIRYWVDHWVTPVVAMFVSGSIPLVIALVRGLDGFTFSGSLCFALAGTLLGFVLHLLLKEIVARHDAKTSKEPQ